jgi:uncharacterized RDD family membrane protein YckC
MKCPKCNYVSFDGVPRCKKCGFVFAQSDASGSGDDIKSIIAEMSAKKVKEPRGDEPPDLDKTVASIRESLDEIEGDTSEESEIGAQDQTIQIDTDNLKLRVDENYIENKKEFPDHTEINWEESVSLANDELHLTMHSGAEKGKEKTTETSDPDVPHTQTKHLKEELQKIGEDLKEIEEMPVASEDPVPSNDSDLHFDISSVKKGGFWIRYAAWIIDTIVLNIIGIILLSIGSAAFDLASSGLQNLETEEMVSIMVPYFLFMLIIRITYFTYFHGSTGQTLGKMVCKLKVVRLNGDPLGYGKAFLRWIGYLLSGIILYLGFLWVAWDKHKQGWHDKIAGTYVIRI